ncbi:MAG: menaquinone biosynthesis protein [Pirellulales bacterium]|nr:menaquinone biosynthesis protein [Pirellulales bacterium]
MRIGAVSYLNSRPLIRFLPQYLPAASIEVDLPSRLADGLSDGRFDVALVPSIEYFRNPGYTIVSDACIASDGPVRSVKLYSRVPVERIRTLALDEGSRTSAALTRILLRERFSLEPAIEVLPIGAAVDDSAADAVMLVGDRGMFPPSGRFHTVWDLGDQWRQWTGLPFVFAMWIARPGLELDALAEAIAAARDEGVRQADRIAGEESPLVGIPEADCRSYFRDNLRFVLGPRERQGLERYCRLAAGYGLVPKGVRLAYADCRTC